VKVQVIVVESGDKGSAPEVDFVLRRDIPGEPLGAGTDEADTVSPIGYRPGREVGRDPQNAGVVQECFSHYLIR
jgi:hypothetical protein